MRSARDCSGPLCVTAVTATLPATGRLLPHTTTLADLSPPNLRPSTGATHAGDGRVGSVVHSSPALPTVSRAFHILASLLSALTAHGNTCGTARTALPNTPPRQKVEGHQQSPAQREGGSMEFQVVIFGDVRRSGYGKTLTEVT